MKKLKNFFRFSFISILVLIVFIFIARYLFVLLWHFDILSWDSYQMIIDYWNNGGVFNTFKDCSLGVALIAFPIIWLYYSRKLYKYGLKKFFTTPIIKTYRYFTHPKSMEVEHVVVKHMGEKGKSLEDIIADKIKEENKKNGYSSASKDLRKQIAAKIGENEEQ